MSVACEAAHQRPYFIAGSRATGSPFKSCGHRGELVDVIVAFAWRITRTTERNDSYWQNLPTTQGGPYDSCLEIFDFVEFSRRLAHALATRYAVFGNLMVNKCFFEANSGTIADGTTKLPSYFRKPEADDFKKQFEARAVLVPYQAQALVPRTFYLNVSDLVYLVG